MMCRCAAMAGDRRFRMPAALLWAFSAEKLFFSLGQRNACGRSAVPFSREGHGRQAAGAAPASYESGGAAEKFSRRTEGVRPIKNAGQSLQDCPALLYSLHHIVEYQLCDLEIEDQAAGVHDGGDEGGSHDGRICTQLLCSQRQHTAHQLCQNDAEE